MSLRVGKKELSQRQLCLRNIHDRHHKRAWSTRFAMQIAITVLRQIESRMLLLSSKASGHASNFAAETGAPKNEATDEFSVWSKKIPFEL